MVVRRKGHRSKSNADQVALVGHSKLIATALPPSFQKQFNVFLGITSESVGHNDPLLDMMTKLSAIADPLPNVDAVGATVSTGPATPTDTASLMSGAIELPPSFNEQFHGFLGCAPSILAAPASSPSAFASHYVLLVVV